ncbi:hypothetical protein B0J11DRAFT_581222 [Dendryphion nanum]|uniref:Carbohydrate esterase family 16 protein n=1 Tax=Dendryphion nanum TaxID=256645 RepID=A0A9P9IJ69_9PLEO|nr:hypothetical protein B0J11DRAFT_581222 [Dendryphion nanum]
MGIVNIVARTATVLAALQWLPGANAVNHLITFGDSYSQTGFDITKASPSASNPLGNPAFPGYTSSGGINWVGYLIKEYNASLLYSYNFAYGGATVNASLVTPYRPEVKSLIDQVAQFSDSHVAKNPQWTAQKSLFGIWMGVNDVGNSYWKNDTKLLGEIIEDYFEQVEILFKAGARNFAFLNVPPIDRSPMMLAQPGNSRDLEARVIQQFNGLLANRTQAFKASHEGVKATVVDTQKPFNTAIDNPQRYGSQNATCWDSNGRSCLWFNDYHPGLAIHKLVAEAVVAAFAWNTTLFRIS